MKVCYLIVLLVLVGCSSSSSPAAIGADPSVDGGQPGPTKTDTANPSKAGASGSRLKARTYTGEDGSQEFIGWFDSQTSANCGFSLANDGKLRCLPFEGLASAGVYWSDAGCTVPLIIATAGCSPTLALSNAPVSACNGAPRYQATILKVGPKHVGDVFNGTPAACSKITVGAPTDLLDPGPEVPASTYVAANETHE